MTIFDPYAQLLKKLNPLLVDSYANEDPYGQGQGREPGKNQYALGPTSSYMTTEYLLDKKKKKKKKGTGLFEQSSPSGLFEEAKKYGTE